MNAPPIASGSGGLYAQLPPSAHLRDVTLRDGLQSLRIVLPTAAKLELYEALVAARVRELQVTSFVNPVRVPQLADADAFWKATFGRSVRKSVLVANWQGFERALNAGAEEVEAVVSVSETYNCKNARRSMRQSVGEIARMARSCDTAAGSCTLTVALANSWHCVFEGDLAPHKVLALTSELLDLGIRHFCICDTTGHATPDKVYGLCRQLQETYSGVNFRVHLHDTRGRGVANAVAALCAGIRNFDAALAGLGGSPFAPGMGGNVSLEALTDTFEQMGVDTGVDVTRLEDARKLVLQAIQGVAKSATGPDRAWPRESPQD